MAIIPKTIFHLYVFKYLCNIFLTLFSTIYWNFIDLHIILKQHIYVIQKNVFSNLWNPISILFSQLKYAEKLLILQITIYLHSQFYIIFTFLCTLFHSKVHFHLFFFFQFALFSPMCSYFTPLLYPSSSTSSFFSVRHPLPLNHSWYNLFGSFILIVNHVNIGRRNFQDSICMLQKIT